MSAVTTESELRISPLELFFDLEFVVAITEVTALIHHDPSPTGVLRGALILAMLYWGWSLFTWTLNFVGNTGLGVRIALHRDGYVASHGQSDSRRRSVTMGPTSLVPTSYSASWPTGLEF